MSDHEALAAAKARYRSMVEQAKAGFGSGVFMMAKGDTIEQIRAAQNARSAGRNHRKKNSLHRLVTIVPEDQFIRFMIATGWYCRPRKGPPTYAGAEEAYRRMFQAMMAAGSITRDNGKMDSASSDGAKADNNINEVCDGGAAKS